MSDYIRREDAIKAVHEEFDDCVVWDESGERTADEVESIIDRVLSADVAPVVHGEWIKEYWHGETVRKCSVCHITQTVNVYEGNVKFNYCPYCGAKMRGEQE